MIDKKNLKLKFPAKYYWGIRVVKELSEDGEIYIYSDYVQIEQGSLVFYCETKEGPMATFVISEGNWLCYFSASLIDGAATKVEHWKGFMDKGL